MVFKNNLPTSIPCFSIHLIGSFTEQKFLISIRSNLAVFPFTNYTSDVESKILLFIPRYWQFSLIFKVFHFELIFLCKRRYLGWDLLFFGAMNNYSSTICWRGCPFSIELLLHFWQNQVSRLYGCFSGFSVLFLIYMSTHPPIPHWINLTV